MLNSCKVPFFSAYLGKNKLGNGETEINEIDYFYRVGEMSNEIEEMEGWRESNTSLNIF